MVKEPEVLRVGDDAWVHIGDLRKVIKTRMNWSGRHNANAVALACRWFIEYLDDLNERPTDGPA
jgi:hypothetical protein